MSTTEPEQSSDTEPELVDEHPVETVPVAPKKDPLRGSRTSGTWIAVVALMVILVLLAIFIMQNTQSVDITFMAWNGQAPLAAALLIAAAAGLLLAAIAGSMRILQLRHRVRRERKLKRKAERG